MPATETHAPGPTGFRPPESPLPLAKAFASTRALTRREMMGAPVRWPRPSLLEAPLQVASAKMAHGLHSLGLLTVGDLLEHLPYASRETRTVGALKAGEPVTVAVEVASIGMRSVRRRGMRPLVQATVRDQTGSMRATFFNQPWLVKRYRPGTRLVLHGRADARGGFAVSHHALGSEAGPGAGDGPEEPGAVADVARGQGAVAHYPGTDGVSSTQILALVAGERRALMDVTEALPAATRVSERLPDRSGALAAMHFPETAADTETGRLRLAFEELLLTQLVFLKRRARRRAATDAPALKDEPSLTARWLERGLPFALTGDQRRVIEAIHSDLTEPRAMQRLLMGEVGSGKTVVALYAMLRAVEHGHQAALMAPTETLAEQHFVTLQRLIGAEAVAVALLTGSTPAGRRRDILGKLSSGELSLVVGTHALIEPDVRFRRLAVAVIDEQHRFGVRQREALRAGDVAPSADAPHPAGAPHTLHMTATPIPRTLALAGYGDLDASTLRELPSGRLAIDTQVVAGATGRERAYEELRRQLSAGRQAYVVCPLVDEPSSSESGGGAPAAGASAGAAGAQAGLGQRAATAEFERLKGAELKGYELVLLHGAMRPREKQQAMSAFVSGRASVLVATTVVEVGIDVPNATIMLVENAERFGISQLHQLRGRVGRGEHRASCFLVGSPGSVKLRAMVEHSDGFRLAELDLELRKEGELVGTRQSGVGQFKVASMPEDAQLLERARARAEAIVATDPELTAPEHALLGQALERAFGSEALEPIPA